MADARKTQESKDDRAISGPGAADFMTAPGGLDRPESGGKGTAALREQSPLDDAQRLAPRSGPDMDSHPDERKPGDDRPGSQTGTIGGGGPEAHNRSPVRATGTDEDANE